jgi:hypothetical protein
MSRTRKLLAALVVAGVAAAGVSAFTDSNTIDPGAGDVAGFSSTTVTGVHAHSITYTTNATGDTITDVNLVLVGDTTHSTIQLGHDGAAVATCSDDPGTYDTTTYTNYDCVVSWSTAAVTSLEIVATNKVNP